MRSEWPLVRLGEVLEKSEEWEDIQADQEYRQITVRLWGKGVVERARVSGSAIAASRQLVAHSGQFILSRIDARHGALGLVPPSLDGAVVSTDFPVFTLNPNRISPEFLAWLSKTSGFVEVCKAASEGTTNRVRLGENRFLGMTISLPPLPEQQRIVARIDALAARIAEAQGLRQEAVEEIGSFVSSMHLSASGKRTVRLGDILVLDEHREEVQFGRSYPQVGVRGFGQGLFSREVLESTQTTYRAFNRLYNGAVVLSQVKGWEGAIAVCGPDLADMYVSPEYRTFRCIPDQARPQYLAALVATAWFWTRLRNVTRGLGGRRERTRPEQFLQMEIPMPPINKQEQVIPVLDRLGALKTAQAATVAELDALLPAILDRAFKGAL